MVMVFTLWNTTSGNECQPACWGVFVPKFSEEGVYLERNPQRPTQPSFPCEKAPGEQRQGANQPRQTEDCSLEPTEFGSGNRWPEKSSLHSSGHSDCSRTRGSGEVVDEVQGAVQHPATAMIALSEGNVCTPVALLRCQRVNALCMVSLLSTAWQKRERERLGCGLIS